MNTRTRNIKRRAAIAVAAVSALILSSCAPGGSSQQGEQAAIEPILRAPGGEGQVEEIQWNLGSGEPDTLRPTNVPTYSGLGVVANLCDSLLSVDEAGTLIPGLTELTMESPTRAVFTLRGDATFWDGTPVTVDDIVFSLNYAASPDSLMAPSFQSVESVEAVSDTSVAINFTTPDAVLIPTLTGAGGAVMQRAFSEAAGETLGTPEGGLMCSGPFRLGDWDPGESLQIVKNENYWDDTRTAKVDVIDFTFVTDTSALTQALGNGEIDGGWEIPTSAIPALTNSDSGELFYGETTSIWSLRIANPDSPIASNDSLRSGLQHIIDREAIARTVFHGAARPWSSAISLNSWPVSVRDEAESRYEAIAADRTFDPELAAELFSQAGEEAKNLEVIVQSGDETASQLSQLLQDQLKTAGVELTIRTLQPLEFAEAMYNPAVRGDSDLILSANGDIVQEPLASIRYFFLEDGSYNWDQFSDQQLEDLFAQAITESDESRRAEITLDIQDRFEEHGGTIAIVNPYQVNFLNNSIGGAITSSQYPNMPSLTFLGGPEN